MRSFREDGDSVRSMFAGIAHRYDLANHVLSGGLDFLWRKRAARLVMGWKPARLLDLATGSGDLALAIQAANPATAIVAADFCAPMVEIARRKGLSNVVVADALSLPFATASFDVVTIAFGLRNMATWEGALTEAARVLKLGGHILILDFSLPRAPLRWLYRPYLHFILPKVATLLTGESAAYEYLGESIERFPCGAAMCRLIETCGFARASSERLSAGIVSIYSAERIVGPSCTEGITAARGRSACSEPPPLGLVEQ